MGKRWFAAAVAVMLCISLCACSSQRDDDRRKRNEVNIVITAKVQQLDHASPSASTSTSMLLDQLMEGLFKADAEGRFVLGQAKDYQVSEDRKTWTFHLRDDIYWSDGSRVTSDDFRFGIEHHLDPATGSTVVAGIMSTMPILNCHEVYDGKAGMETLGIETPDDQTIILHLSSPGIAVEETLASQTLPIKRDFFNQTGDSYGSSADTFLSNGAYRLVGFEPLGTQFRFEKNEGYYAKDTVSFSAANYRVVDSAFQELMCYNSDEADVIDISGEEAALRKSLPDFHDVPALAVNMMIMNEEDAVMSNVNIRRALALSLNKKAIMQNVYKVGGKECYGLATNAIRRDGVDINQEAAVSQWQKYDPETALECWKKGLEELGKSEIRLRYSSSNSANAFEYAAKEQWEKMLPGLTVEIQGYPIKLLMSKIESGDFQMARTGWSAEYGDPYAMLELFTPDGFYSNTNYHNPDYMELLDKANSTEALADEQLRISLLEEAEGLILDDAAVIPLFSASKPFLVDPHIHAVFDSKGLFSVKYSSYSDEPTGGDS